MVVSSLTPLHSAATLDQRPGVSVWRRASRRSTIANSSLSAVEGAGTRPAFSNSSPLWIRSVASPPSSTICVGPWPPPKSRARSVRFQYSSRVSPFQAKTGTPAGLSTVPVGPTTTAAAAWSCVEKMLHDAQRTSAPRAFSVSMRTAVWMVMWRLPVTRCPFKGCVAAYSLRSAIRPGISCSARTISLRPHSARPRSATLYSRPPFLEGADTVVVMVFPFLSCVLFRRRSLAPPSIPWPG